MGGNIIMNKQKVILTILDGWGYREESEFNAIKAGKTPNFDKLLTTYPYTFLQASGNYVGLPDGQMGNSEVGHTNIGAGRIVYQDLTKITKAVREKTFFKNEVLLSVRDKLKENGGRLHIFGLVSPGGVHSSMDHLYALIDFAAENKLPLYVHAFLDGRDTPPKSAQEYLKELQKYLDKTGNGSIATIMGRFYVMDRDKRWDRVEKAYNALTSGEALSASTADEAITEAYKNGETDEFVSPYIIGGKDGILKDGDGAIFFNFRSDRAREISTALNFDDFDGFERKKRINFSIYATMTQYKAEFPFPVLYPPEELTNILGEVISKEGLSQLRIAETEKYAHVTFFFNGGKETVFENEERILIPSPKVKTYDMQPEMSAYEVTDALLEVIEKYDLVILNFANPDMVGHTGIFEAAIKAVETIDECLGKILNKVLEENRTMFVTADHGNVDLMYDEKTKTPVTAHTTNPVYFIAVNHPEKITLHEGILADIAPTILKTMKIEIPSEMTGKPLY